MIDLLKGKLRSWDYIYIYCKSFWFIIWWYFLCFKIEEEGSFFYEYYKKVELRILFVCIEIFRRLYTLNFKIDCGKIVVVIFIFWFGYVVYCLYFGNNKGMFMCLAIGE